MNYKKLHPDAIIARASEGAAGYDLKATSMHIDYDKGYIVYGTGIALELEHQVFGDIRARSSLNEVGPWCMVHIAGVGDSDYRGEIKVKFKPLLADIDIRSEQPYKLGERIAQIVFMEFLSPKLEEAGSLSTTKRSNKGFGNTGK